MNPIDTCSQTFHSTALSFESSNYNARVFLALAKLNLGKHDESEAEYRQAIDLQPSTALAWQVCRYAYFATGDRLLKLCEQGLASFYEKTENWQKYIEIHRKLADLANEAYVQLFKTN